MIVYVESNFVLEMALEQEQSSSASELASYNCRYIGSFTENRQGSLLLSSGGGIACCGSREKLPIAIHLTTSLKRAILKP